MPTAEIIEIHCAYDPGSKSGTEGADKRKVKGNIQWLSAAHAQPAKVRLYDRLFVDAHPDAGDEDYKSVSQSSLEKDHHRFCGTLAQPGSAGRTLPDSSATVTSSPKGTEASQDKPVFNRAVTLRDSWGNVPDLSRAIRFSGVHK